MAYLLIVYYPPLQCKHNKGGNFTHVAHCYVSSMQKSVWPEMMILDTPASGWLNPSDYLLEAALCIYSQYTNIIIA